MPTIYNPNKRKGLFFIPSGAIKSESAAFSYSQDSYRVDESNPTPTITGDTGGTFTATPEGLSINSSTGELTLSTSTINSYTVTYTLPSGTFENRSLGIEAAAFASTQSFSFDGVDDYFYTSSPSLSISDAWSVSTWVKTNDKTSDGGSFRGWFTTGGWDIASNFKFAVRSDNGYASVWKSNSEVIVGNSNITDNNWYNVVVTKTASNITLFVNGTQQATVSNSETWLFNNIYLGAGGQSTNITTAGMWNGSVDEVAIWNSALSSAAITEIYNSGVTNDLDELTNASDPTVWYRCGE